MSIFKKSPPPPLSVNDIVNNSKIATEKLYESTVAQVTVIFNLIWRNPNFTPKQIVDAYGTDAATLFSVLENLQNILAVNPDFVRISPPSQYSFTINQDGTVSVTDAVI